ncbi:MAG: SusC/RagA family TonB-linked outer membrane protein [Candidatus Pedobacter colombiensis]|uniref:SusC/RagA family TonB-linked outer membrane protein n=1 Tax=Candidatus Pedobacter colombiensis TaxID=3121371 RepID=A0AAJ5WC05_9SPHI|nr:SusC/RagA family TonB-linked outer membrane protein [Pedobacter sp.]WEK19932.1 MAG: SusC/RagA family TonB-linked outer membrane protein [Pedobacter sp.]
MNKILDALRVMKLIICLLIISLQASAVAFSQNISLSEKNASIESVIKKIEKQSGYSFFYKIDLLRNNLSKVNLSLKNVTVDQALQQTLSNQPLTFVIVNKTVIIKPKPAVGEKNDSPEAKKPVRGKVTDSKGPIPGVSVKIDGTNLATMTDANGSFTLNLTPGTYRIVFSSVGYESKRIEKVVTETDDSEINVVLNVAIAQLQEAVVLGYTTKNASEITGSLQTFSARQLEGVTSNNLISQLKGKVAGMYITEPSGDPNKKATFVVRGQGTIPDANLRVTNNLNPLIVVDGIIYSDVMYPSDIVSSTDIETISLLKDAASTAIFGSRASQGVLVITTKRGLAGQSQLNINGSFGISQRYMGKIEFMNSQELYDYQRKMLLNSFAIKTENLTQDAYMAKYLPPASVLGTNTDWNKQLYRNGLTKTLDMSLLGGTEKTRYYFGANNYDEQGPLRGNDLKRNSFKLNLDQNITPKLTFSANLSAIFDKGDGSQITGSPTLLPWYTPYNDDGTPKKVMGTDVLNNITQNPLYDMPFNSTITNTQQVLGVFAAKYKVYDWLTLSSNNSYNTTFITSNDYKDRLSLSGLGNKGSLTQRKTNSYSFLTSNLITARKKFGLHTVGGIGGFEYNKGGSEYNALAVRNMPTGIKVPSSASDVWNTFSGGKSFIGEKFVRGSYSLFTEGNYNYDDRYFANASYRMDYSTNFGIDNRAGNFYSVSGAWLATNEQFLRGNKYLTNLKIRGSYGTNGKIAGEDFLTESFYNFAYQYSGDPSGIINQLGNRQITWEHAHVANLGIDLGLFNRVSLSTDFYRKRTTGLLQKVATSSLLGVPSQYQNIGAILNHGVEIVLDSKNLVGAFKWETSLNLTFNKNKVEKLNGGKIIFGNAGVVKEGDDISSVHTYKWLGVDPQTGQPQFERLERDPVTNAITSKVVNTYDDISKGLTGDDLSRQQQLIGNTTPKYYGGMLNTFGYKGIELSVLLNFAADYLVYNNSRPTYFSSEGNDLLKGNQIKPSSGQSIWEKPGDIATEPMIYRNRTDGANQSTSRFWEDATHIRVRNVRLSYSLPAQLISAVKLKRANIYVSGDNLYIFTKKSFYGVDPEGGLATDQNNYGVSAGYGASRKYLLGLQLTF